MLDTSYTIKCDADYLCRNEIRGSFKSTIKQKALGLGWTRRGGWLGTDWFCPKCRAEAAGTQGDGAQ